MPKCDLCHSADAVRRYPTRPAYDHWLACAACAELIDTPDPAGLFFHALKFADALGRETSDIRRTHQAFWFTLDLLTAAVRA